MKKIQGYVVFICLAISLFLALFSVLLTAAGIIITATLFMLFSISESAGKAMDKPILSAFLGEDGRSVIIRNIGNRDAKNIKISVIPSNLEFFMESLPADSEAIQDLGQLFGNGRVIMNYTGEDGEDYNRNTDLKLRDYSEYDPTKPLIPIFK